MKKYKLYHFNTTGFAEPIRYFLSYCGNPFEDKRLDYTSQWLQTYKKEMPMERMPVLEIDGVKYHQHLPICRYIARKNQLCGSNDEEDYQMDALVTDMHDISLDVATWYKQKDPQLKLLLKEKTSKELLFYLSRFETRVERNNGLFVGKKLSWTDIYYASISEGMSKLLQRDLQDDDYPSLNKLSNDIRRHPMIAAYIEKRPHTDI